MNNYKFKVKKISENTIEIKENNHKKAILKLMQLLAFADDEIFKNSKDINVNYEVLLKEIENMNNKNKKITEKNIGAFSKEIDTETEEIDNEIDDIFNEEYIEIVCDKCGNCIQIDDEDLLSE